VGTIPTLKDKLADIVMALPEIYTTEQVYSLPVAYLPGNE
jgi:hypothetical protein